MGKKKDVPLKIDTEEERQKLSTRLNLATRAAQMGIWDWDIQKNELVWDDQMYRLYGLEPGDFGGAYEAWLNGVHPDDRASSNEESQQAVRGEKEYDTEFRVLWPDGSIHWLKANGQVFRDEKGNPLRMVGVNYDITKRKQSQEQLQQSEERFSKAFESTPTALVLSRLSDSKFEFVNDSFLKLTEYQLDEVINKSPAELNLFPNPAELADVREMLLKTGKVRNLETSIRSKGGEIRYVTFSVDIIQLNGKPYSLTTMIDTTEHRRAEEQLRESEELLRLAYEAANLGIWKNDLQTGSVEFDERARVHYGFDTLRTTLSEVTDRVHPEDVARLGAEIAAATAPTSKGKFSTEYRVVHPDGSVHWLAIGVQITFEGEGEVRRSVMGYGTSLDITERKQAEEALREREQKLNTVLNLLPVGVSILDQDREIVYSNETLEKILGITKEGLLRGEYRNRKYLRADGSEKPTEELASLRASKEGVEMNDIITGVVKEDGQTIWTSVNAVPVNFSDWKVILVTSDITHRKLVEENLRQSEEKFALAFHKSPVALSLTRMADGKFIDVNEMFQNTFEYTRDELIGHTSIELNMISPDVRRKLMEHQRATGGVQNVEVELRAKSGKLVSILFSSGLLTLYGETYILTTLINITEKKFAEQALKQRTEELEQLLEILPSAIWIAEDPECKIIRGNRYANELLGVSKAENVSQSSESSAVRLRQFSNGRELAPDELPMQVAARTGQPQVDFELRIERPDQTTRVLIGGAVPLFDLSKKTRGAVAAFFDITDLKTTEDELRRSNAELEQFAYIASHDLQEPLRTLAGMVQLLQKRYQGQLDDRADEYIAHAVESADRMQALIKDLLAYSRVDRRSQPIEEVSAQDCLRISLKNLDASIRESHATIMAEALPIVYADSTQLTQLFQNLIGNSIKFCGEREPRIQVTATRQNAAWQFAVSDNGIGIEAQYFERIFLVFQRLHTRRQYQGTGIGLALCKKIVERHGGSIWVESSPGEGSTFYFTLPIRSTP